MKHPSEAQLLAFLEGEATRTEAAAIDAHLIVCESCWQAVREDRLGRQLTESLRTTPSPQLRDRIRLAVELAAGEVDEARPVSLRRRRRARAAAAAVIVGMGTGGGVIWGVLPGTRPSAVSAVVEAAKALEASPTPVTGLLRAPTADQPLRLEGHRYQEAFIVVALSPRQFPMPRDAVGSAGGSAMTWTATEDGIDLYCVNGDEPMLLAGRVPTAQLVQLASQILHD